MKSLLAKILGFTSLGAGIWIWWTSPRSSAQPEGSCQSGPVASNLQLGALSLRYWSFLRRHTMGLIRPLLSKGGVDITLLGLCTLIHLGSPTEQANRITWPVQWGLLVGRSGGSFSFVLQEDRLLMRLDGFVPRLPRPLYLATQHLLHCWIGNSLLRELSRT